MSIVSKPSFCNLRFSSRLLDHILSYSKDRVVPQRVAARWIAPKPSENSLKWKEYATPRNHEEFDPAVSRVASRVSRWSWDEADGGNRALLTTLGSELDQITGGSRSIRWVEQCILKFAIAETLLDFGGNDSEVLDEGSRSNMLDGIKNRWPDYRMVVAASNDRERGMTYIGNIYFRASNIATAFDLVAQAYLEQDGSNRWEVAGIYLKPKPDSEYYHPITQDFSNFMNGLIPVHHHIST